LANALLIISLVVTPVRNPSLGPVASPLYKIATAVNPDLANELSRPGFLDART
jgi:hypothetical protein